MTEGAVGAGMRSGATSREEHLPASARWIEIHSGRDFDGGQRIAADAPYEYIPVFRREGADVGL